MSVPYMVLCSYNFPFVRTCPEPTSTDESLYFLVGPLQTGVICHILSLVDVNPYLLTHCFRLQIVTYDLISIFSAFHIILVYISSEMFAHKEVSWLILLNIFLHSLLVYIHVTNSERQRNC